VNKIKLAAGTSLGVATAAVLGVATGIMITHGPTEPAMHHSTPAAVVQMLDTTTDAPASTTTTEQPPVNLPSSNTSVVTIDNSDPEHPVTIIAGPPPAPQGPSGEMQAAMPVDPNPTITADVAPPVVTPEMPPGYPTPSPAASPTTPTN
jgi:cytoskeletal protein RodZ